jgi:hypothetical protein
LLDAIDFSPIGQEDDDVIVGFDDRVVVSDDDFVIANQRYDGSAGGQLDLVDLSPDHA